MKYIGWITFFVVIIGLSIGGFVLIKNTDFVFFLLCVLLQKKKRENPVVE